MLDALVSCELLDRAFVEWRFVGHERGSAQGLGEQERLQGVNGDIGDVIAHHVAVALDQRIDRLLDRDLPQARFLALADIASATRRRRPR